MENFSRTEETEKVLPEQKLWQARPLSINS
jgi:hypothetical protein